MKQRTLYVCEYCGFESEDRAEAEACEATPVERLDVKPGDLVTAGGAYGWWSEDREWFHEERHPNPLHHLDHAQLGWPKFVVLAIVPQTAVRPGQHGKWMHCEAAIIYSPKHANMVYERKSLTDASGGLRKVGEVTPEQLAELKADAVKYFGPDADANHRSRLLDLVPETD